jgi:hypothetical protein
VVKVSGKIAPVKLTAVNPRGGWDGTNVQTNRPVHVRGAGRLRGIWPKKTMPIVDDVAPSGKAAASAAHPSPRPAGADTGERDATVAKKERSSLLNLAARVLAESSEPLNCQQMVERVLATGLWQSEGKTPAATLASAIIREIAKKGEAARFRKVDRGKFQTVAQ